jgi:G3E family GTPase
MMKKFAAKIVVATALVAGGMLNGANTAAARTAWTHDHRYHRSHHHSHHAKTHEHRSRQTEVNGHAGVTCETVRAFVSQVGLAAAKAMAQANGMTSAQEHRARRCLASKD